MRLTFRPSLALLPAVGLLFLLLVAPARADEPEAKPQDPAAEEDRAEAPDETLDLLTGIRRGTLSVDARGLDASHIVLTVSNRSRRRLRVILPPGLVASGLSGQFGGMGGMGGGMGGMGGMMGGMGGGMGRMGGGMGGMGGGMGRMGGMGGGMGRRGRMGGMGGGVMPPRMGMMMIAGVIVRLCGEFTSWDYMSQRLSFMASMMGGMRGGMMGGMGGGMMGGMGGMGGMMGGMGGMGGMMGGMGGGFRSVPPAGPASTILKSHQTKRLPVAVVSLDRPTNRLGATAPAAGERLSIGDISQMTTNPRVRLAMRRLAQDKAPETIGQLVMWNVAAGVSWEALARIASSWATPQDLSLARRFVEQLDTQEGGVLPNETARLFVDTTTETPALRSLAQAFREVVEGRTILGMTVTAGIPPQSAGPAVACRIRLSGTVADARATVEVMTADGLSDSWAQAGQFTLDVPGPDQVDAAVAAAKDALARAQAQAEAQATTEAQADETTTAVAATAPAKPQAPDPLLLRAALLADQTAEGTLGQLIHVRLITKAPAKPSRGHKSQKDATPTYAIQIENVSPLILDSLAVLGVKVKAEVPAPVASPLGVAPHHYLTVPASAEMVASLGLTDGVRAIAADFNGL